MTNPSNYFILSQAVLPLFFFFSVLKFISQDLELENYPKNQSVLLISI